MRSMTEEWGPYVKIESVTFWHEASSFGNGNFFPRSKRISFVHINEENYYDAYNNHRIRFLKITSFFPKK